MHYIPRIVLDEIEKCLCQKFEEADIFKRKIMTPDELKELIAEIMVADFGYDYKPISDVKGIRTKVMKRIRQTKKYWLKQVEEQEGDDPIDQELRLLKQIPNVPSMQFSISNLDETDYRNHRMQELRDWAKDSRSPIIAYPFLSEQPPTSIEKATRNDVIRFIAEYIIEEFGENGDLRKAIEDNPEVVSQPIWSDKSLYKEEPQVAVSDEEGTHQVTMYDFTKDGTEFSFQTSLPLKEGDILEDGRIENHQPDEKDMEIIRFIFRQRDADFYKTKAITFDLRQLILEIYKSAGAKNYEAVENRLHKLANLRFEMTIKGDSKKKEGTTSWTFFDSLLINNDENGRRYVYILLGNTVYEQMINNQTTKIYQREVASLELKLSKFLIHALQKERLMLHAEGGKLSGTYSVGFFLSHARMNHRKLAKNMELIEQSLQEFKDLGIIIDNYRPRKKQFEFEIVFKPLSPMEEADYSNKLTAPSLPLN